MREKDEDFSPTERLYRGLDPRWGEATTPSGLKVVLMRAIRFPRFSVNRGKYSNPKDVLTPDRRDWKVGAFQVQALLSTIVRNDESEYSFRVKDDPTPENEAHAEVRLFKDGVEFTGERFRIRLIKREIRSRLLDNIEILSDQD